jgi:hypothetical protein
MSNNDNQQFSVNKKEKCVKKFMSNIFENLPEKSDNAYTNTKSAVKKMFEMSPKETYKELISTEMPYRNLYIEAFGTTNYCNPKPIYSDKLFKLEYKDGKTKDVGNLISGDFRHYSCVTMFNFKFKNNEGICYDLDTEKEQPKIIMLD